jgi:hypothetical protein
LALAACGPSDGRDNGPGRAVLTAEDVSVLAESESLAGVRDMMALPSGDVWVINTLEPLFLGYLADGTSLGEHGRLGGGPGEFGAPTTFVTDAGGGGAWVFDAERHAVVEVSGVGGEARREIALPTDGSLPPTHLFGGRELIGEGVRAARLGERIVFARNAPAMEGGFVAFWRAIWTADLVIFDPADGSVELLTSLGEALGDPDEAFELVGDFPPFPFWFRLWTVCGGSVVHVYDRLGNQVQAFAEDGSRRQPRALPPLRTRRVTKEDVARVGFGLGMLEAGGELDSRATSEDSARVITLLSARVGAEGEQLDALLPRYVDLQCSTDGTLWLRRFDVGRGDLRGGLEWVALRPDGTTREVTFPEGFDAYRFLEDRVLGAQRNALDVASVAWLRLPG